MNDPIVYVVDDDAAVRDALDSLIRSAGLRVQTYASSADFLACKFDDAPACLVLDVKLPGSNGLDLQRRLAGSAMNLPIICITGHIDIRMTVTAMKAGAMEFLTKPLSAQDLMDAIRQAIERGRADSSKRVMTADLKRRFESLTPREREVMQLVATGLLNKQIAARLGTSEVTIKLHRRQVMQKMRAHSLADLVRMAERLFGIDLPPLS